MCCATSGSNPDLRSVVSRNFPTISLVILLPLASIPNLCRRMVGNVFGGSIAVYPTVITFRHRLIALMTA
tara:strand:- start:280 stop:489 length:210 start_codon:yes stop_codon:yes gene_type:complete